VTRSTPDATRRALASRGAPFEYWYLKVHSGDLAFLVDFIVRRTSGRAEVRLSYWVRGAAHITHETHERWEVDGPSVRVGEATFDDEATRGMSSDVRWDLRFTPGRRWLAPGRVGALLRAFDSQIVLSPGARVSGEVAIDGETFRLDDASGVLTHYWSLRLPERWLWLSENTDALDVEALFTSQRLWRLPWPRLPVAYVFVDDGERARYVISPLTGFARATGTRDDVRVRAWGPRAGMLDITATRGNATRNDLGEGITQTLIADARVGDRSLRGRMGLETRGWR
jgi:hypothetical protein